MTRILTRGRLVALLLIALFVLGPRPPRPALRAALPTVETDLATLDSSIRASEAQVPAVKPDNHARILWADATHKAKTPYSAVYLHGLGGSQRDGFPIHKDFAKRYGMNLYLARLHGHGIASDDALAGLTPENFLESASHALAVGRALGDRVILMASSTGATLALILASCNPDIEALILFSPNIDFHEKFSTVLTWPWGLQLARLVVGGRYIISSDPESVSAYWYPKYRIEALVAAKSLLHYQMTRKTFVRIHQPLFVGYYYKNDDAHDTRVSLPRILEMVGQVSTPERFKRIVAFPNAAHHVIASATLSLDVESVRREVYLFAEEMLNLAPGKSSPRSSHSEPVGNSR